MKRVRVRSWAELDALPADEWVEVVGGVDLRVIDGTRSGRRREVVIPVGRKVARSLAPRLGEVLEARVRGTDIVLIRRRARGRPSRGPSA